MIEAGIHPRGFIVIVNSLSAVCDPPAQLSEARTVKFEVSAFVGIPVIIPEDPMFRPVGNAPEITLNVTGDCPPEVLNWYEYA